MLFESRPLAKLALLVLGAAGGPYLLHEASSPKKASNPQADLAGWTGSITDVPNFANNPYATNPYAPNPYAPYNNPYSQMPNLPYGNNGYPLGSLASNPSTPTGANPNGYPSTGTTSGSGNSYSTGGTTGTGSSTTNGYGSSTTGSGAYGGTSGSTPIGTGYSGGTSGTTNSGYGGTTPSTSSGGGSSSYGTSNYGTSNYGTSSSGTSGYGTSGTGTSSYGNSGSTTPSTSNAAGSSYGNYGTSTNSTTPAAAPPTSNSSGYGSGYGSSYGASSTGSSATGAAVSGAAAYGSSNSYVPTTPPTNGGVAGAFTNNMGAAVATSKPAFQTDPKSVPTVEQLQQSAPMGSLTGGPIQDLREVVRFDVTPAWVTARFTRVSTMLSELELDGLRVPLVTGTQVHDLVGTLTYYFDKQQRVQRITFHGQTGDDRPLVQLLESFYHFKNEPALGGKVYMVRWNGTATSVLKISPAPVIYASQPGSQFSIMLEINQPNMPFGLSKEAATLVEEGKKAGRW